MVTFEEIEDESSEYLVKKGEGAFCEQWSREDLRERCMFEAGKGREEGNVAFRRANFEAAADAYAGALEALASISKHDAGKADVECNTLEGTLRSNRAAALLALRQHEKARREAELACSLLRNPARREKAHYRLAMALYHLGYTDKALESLRSGLQCSSVLNEDMADSARRCERRLVSAQACRRASSMLASDNNAKKGSPAFGAHSLDESTSVHLLRQLIASLSGDDIDDDDEILQSQGTLAVIFEQVLQLVSNQAVCRAGFNLLRGFTGLLPYLTAEFHSIVRQILTAACAEPGSWPTDVLSALVRGCVDGETDPAVQVSLARLLADAAQDADVSYALFGQDGKDSVTIAPIFEVLNSPERIISTFSLDTVQALGVMINGLTSSTECRLQLASAHLRPLKSLINLFDAADRIGEATSHLEEEEESNLHLEGSEEEVTRMQLQREAANIFKPQVVAIQHSSLEALLVLAKDPAIVCTEDGEGPRSIDSILSGLMKILRQLHDKSPKKLAPLLGQDGVSREYVKRPYAADYRDNPFGDMLVNLDFGIVDGINNQWKPIRQSSSSRCDDDVSLIERVIAILSTLSKEEGSTNATALYGIGVLDLMERFGTYATPALRASAEELSSNIVLRCRQAAGEALHSECPLLVRSVALAIRKRPELGMRGIDILLKDISTCDGDAFVDLSRAKGVLHAALSCTAELGGKMQKSTSEEMKECHRRLLSVCEELLMQAAERVHRSDENGSFGEVWESKHKEIEASVRAARERRQSSETTTSQSESIREKILKTSSAKPKFDKWQRPIYYGEDHASIISVKADRMTDDASDATTTLPEAGKTVTKGKVAASPPAPPPPTSAPPQAVNSKSESPLKAGFFGSRRRRHTKGRTRASPDSNGPGSNATSEKNKVDKVAAGGGGEGVHQNSETLEACWWTDEDEPTSLNAGEEEEDGYDEDGLRVVADSGATGEVRKARREWLGLSLRDKLRWTQNSTDITAWIRVPRLTRRRDVTVQVTPTRLTVSLAWYGKVMDGPLKRRCKAGESCWILEEEEVQIILPKDDAQFWRALFEGGEEKGYYEVLQEMVHAEDNTPSYDDLPERSKDLIDEIRERQELISEGLLDLDGLDDFRCVLGDGDGAK